MPREGERERERKSRIDKANGMRSCVSAAEREAGTKLSTYRSSNRREILDKLPSEKYYFKINVTG